MGGSIAKIGAQGLGVPVSRRRGTPFGTAVPTLKVATNTALAAAKPHWIDWDAMANPDAEAFAAKVFAVASGELACNEVHGDRGIAIFKDGVTL